ncbi:hypothetical protein Trad_1375 [Truepera radiovictrix DSM 17093]|uniref:Uncharacterized protein n=1 Tax=Truepera radiovictrix (strain DSM 17093 / CIP 108686 / LMG 22925 / RQ-24) TaxID=649638 RepID=D7CWY9_TRURR|nr:hypothetical protein Trad_1375 [Truepera radiovictrix DSM 17093]
MTRWPPAPLITGLSKYRRTAQRLSRLEVALVVLRGLFPVGSARLASLPLLPKLALGTALLAALWLRPSFWLGLVLIIIVRQMMILVLW